MKTKLLLLITLSLVLTACVNETSTPSNTQSGLVPFVNGDLMTNVSVDLLGNELIYPTGVAAITSQLKVWKPGFKSPWHYHPYTGVAYIIQGELTVNFDTNTSLTDSLQQKGTVSTQTYKAGDKAFLGVANTWHFSENLADKDLIFMVTWIGEKNKPIAVLE